MLVWNTFRHDARVLNEAETLARHGYRVTVHALALPGIIPPVESMAFGIKVQRVGGAQGKRQLKSARARAKQGPLGGYLKALGSLATQLRMMWAVWRARPELIHAHDVNMLPAAWVAAKLARVPLIYDAHEISTHREGYKGMRKVVGWLEKRIMPRAAGTITTTDARARFFARAYGIERPIVLQNRPRFQEVMSSDRIRDELELRQAWPIIVYQGGQQSGRGLFKLVEAATLVDNAYFVLVGGGSLTEELQARVEQSGLSERVFFIPTVLLTELPKYTASADIGVQPIENTCLNHFTTDSNKLFEYVQAGLPVVASDLPEIRRVVNENDLGLLVEPGNTEALAAAINRLVNNKSLRMHYASKARQAAVSLSWEAQEHKLLELYARVLGRPDQDV